MMERQQQGNFNNKATAASKAINNIVQNVAKDDFSEVEISSIRKQFKRIILNVGGHDMNDY